MPIEFDCPHCRHRLRTPDDKAGMSAKCPACGKRVWIPYQQESAASEKPSTPDDADFIDEPPPLRDDEPPPLRDDEPPPLRDDEPPPLRDEEPARVRHCPECGGDNSYSSQECEFCGAPLRRRRRGRASDERRDVRTEDLDIGAMMSDAWTIYTRDMAALVLGPLLLGLAVFVATVPVFLCIAFTGVFAMLIAPPLSWFLTAVSAIGANYLYFKAARRQRPEIGDAFAAFSDGSAFLGGMFVYVLLYSLLLIVGFLLLIIPGLFLVCIGWVMPRVLIDEGLDGIQAISRGWEIATGELGTTLLIALVCAGIGLVGGLVPFGYIFVGPYLGLLCTVAYLRMTGQAVASEPD